MLGTRAARLPSTALGCRGNPLVAESLPPPPGAVEEESDQLRRDASTGLGRDRLATMPTQRAKLPFRIGPKDRARPAWRAGGSHGAFECDSERPTHLPMCQNAEVALLHKLSRTYRRMIREKRPEELSRWLTATGGSQRAMRAGSVFCRRSRRDSSNTTRRCKLHSQSRAGSGQAEGQINRLKTLKRMMYGRLGFALLRKRVLYTA